MSAFFEALPPAPPPPPEHRPPPWSAPPDNELGASVPVYVRLALTDTVAVAVSDMVAFSTGFSFHFVVRQRAPGSDDHRIFDDIHRVGLSKPDAIRFGVQYSDGRKATTLSRRFGNTPHERADVVLAPGGGSSSPRSSDMGMWVWPLPPRGPVAFVCEWLAESIPLTRVEIDAEQILGAAAQSRPLWPDERPLPTGPWTHVVGP